MSRRDAFLLLAALILVGACTVSTFQVAWTVWSLDRLIPDADALTSRIVWGWSAVAVAATILGIIGGYGALRSGVARHPCLLAFFCLYSLSFRVDRISLGWPWQFHAGLFIGRIGIGINFVGLAMLAWYSRNARWRAPDPPEPE